MGDKGAAKAFDRVWASMVDGSVVARDNDEGIVAGGVPLLVRRSKRDPAGSVVRRDFDVGFEDEMGGVFARGDGTGELTIAP